MIEREYWDIDEYNYLTEEYKLKRIGKAYFTPIGKVYNPNNYRYQNLYVRCDEKGNEEIWDEEMNECYYIQRRIRKGRSIMERF